MRMPMGPEALSAKFSPCMAHGPFAHAQERGVPPGVTDIGASLIRHFYMPGSCDVGVVAFRK